MTNINKPNSFVNGTPADANQVNQDFDTLYNWANGNVDGTNIKDGSVTSSDMATEAITPTLSEGLPYASDLFGGSFLLNGFTVTKDGSIATQIDVAAGVAYLKQPDGTVRRMNVISTSETVSSASATYYLDLKHDGTWSFATGHSSDANYINVATVTTDASGNVSAVTQNTGSYAVTLLSGATGPVAVQGLVQSISKIKFWALR